MHAFSPKLILVATDFSDTAAGALRRASALAERHGARLLVMYADEFIPPLNETPRQERIAARGIDDLVAVAHDRLVAHAAENVSSYVPFVVRAVIGDPTNAIVRQAKESEADLVVMGTHGHTGIERLLFGSVCEAVMRKASVPVLAVSAAAAAHPSSDMRRIVCVVDYSPECAEALRIAAALAPEARLVIVKPDEGERAPHTSDRLMQLRRWLPAELVDRCELRLAGAFTPEHIAEFAVRVGADLIAAGFIPRNAVSDALLGTATDRLVQHSVSPVLVVNAAAVREQEVADFACACSA